MLNLQAYDNIQTFYLVHSLDKLLVFLIWCMYCRCIVDKRTCEWPNKVSLRMSRGTLQNNQLKVVYLGNIFLCTWVISFVENMDMKYPDVMLCGFIPGYE